MQIQNGILSAKQAIRRTVYGALAGIFVASGMLLTLPKTASAATRAWCEELTIPVALEPGGPKNYSIRGQHCNPSSPSITRSIDVLVPGGTYDSLYWDFPYNNYQHSYVQRTLQAGRATFNFDRLGTGESSKPLSTQVTFSRDAYAMHQAVQWLKNTYGYLDVTAVGHSMGSMVAVEEAATYKDVDRVVATGFLHSPGINLILTLGTGLYPATLDPQFAGAGLDPGYITTIPGQRAKVFYSGNADPAVIAYDEAHKDIVSLTAAVGVVNQILSPPLLNNSRNVTVPVLTIVGDQDILCGPILIGADCSTSAGVYNHEKPYYPKAASFTAKVVPNTGHNLPLHPSANESFSVIDQWIKTR